MAIWPNPAIFVPLTETPIFGMKLPVLKISALLSCMAFCKAKAQGVAEITGLASIYHSKFEGKKTAAGELFNQSFLTAAHKTLPFNTLIEVINPDNKKSIIVRINDRGPYGHHRLIDLSETGAKLLGFLGKGVGEVTIRILRWGGATSPKALPDLEPQTTYFATDSLMRRTNNVRVHR